jgi:hypothetical protein
MADEEKQDQTTMETPDYQAGRAMARMEIIEHLVEDLVTEGAMEAEDVVTGIVDYICERIFHSGVGRERFWNQLAERWAKEKQTA